MENNQEKRRNCGGLWKKMSDKGPYYYIQIEIDGVKHAFVAYPNKFKDPSNPEDKQPDQQVYPYVRGGGKAETKKATPAKKPVVKAAPKKPLPPPVIEEEDNNDIP
jgi:hypothetical protein